MKISFSKYILIFLFLYSCVTIDEVHGINNLKKQSESLQLNITNSNDVLDLIGPPQNIGIKNENIWYYHEVHRSRNIYGDRIITSSNVLKLEFNELGILKDIIFLDKNALSKNNPIEDTTLSLAKDTNFLSSFLASMRQRAKNYGKTNEQ